MNLFIAGIREIKSMQDSADVDISVRENARARRRCKIRLLVQHVSKRSGGQGGGTNKLPKVWLETRAPRTEVPGDEIIVNASFLTPMLLCRNKCEFLAETNSEMIVSLRTGLASSKSTTSNSAIRNQIGRAHV